jgi:hypothetical protein
MNKQRLFESVMNEIAPYNDDDFMLFAEWCNHRKAAHGCWPTMAEAYVICKDLPIKDPRAFGKAAADWHLRKYQEQKAKEYHEKGYDDPDFQHYWKWCKMDCDPRMLDVEYAYNKWKNQ